MHLVSNNTSFQQELKVKMEVWIVSNLQSWDRWFSLGSVFIQFLQLPVVVGVQLMCLPCQMLKAMVLDGLWRSVEISAQPLCSTMGSSLGLVSVLFWTSFASWEGDRIVSV